MVSKCPKASCEICLMRQPTLESAGEFNKDNPDHWECALECAVGNSNFPDRGHLCFEYVADYT